MIEDFESLSFAAAVTVELCATPTCPLPVAPNRGRTDQHASAA
jgi:hypothetical protein